METRETNPTGSSGGRPPVDDSAREPRGTRPPATPHDLPRQADASGSGRSPRGPVVQVERDSSGLADSFASLSLSEAPPSLRNPLLGTPYKPLCWLTIGGMGEVWEAEDESGRKVIVKLLHTEMVTSESMVERMRREARALADLDHPNVVRVLRFGMTPEGRPYIVMERLYGRTLLAEIKERGVLPLAEAVSYIGQILRGLRAAHERGLVHRDIKLENIFLSDQGDAVRQIKVLDFGFARFTAQSADGGRSAPLTTDDMFVGTPRYAAPEQVLSSAVDARADLYAAGLVFYALLSGDEPFSLLSRAEHLFFANSLLAVDLTRLRCPADSFFEVHAIISRAVARVADERFQTADEFLQALDQLEAKLALSAAPDSPSARGQVLSLRGFARPIRRLVTRATDGNLGALVILIFAIGLVVAAVSGFLLGRASR